MSNHLARSLLALLPSAALAALPACGDAGSNEATTGESTSAGESGGGGPGGTSGTGGAGGEEPPPPPPPLRQTIAGDVTWNVTFDDAAKTAGAILSSRTTGPAL